MRLVRFGSVVVVVVATLSVVASGVSASGAATEGTIVAGGNGSGNAADQLWNPQGVAVDGAGNLYIADQANARVQRWAPGATAGVTVAGGNGSGGGANQLSYPVGVAIDGSGNLYVIDPGNHRVQRWAPGATTGSTVAGGNGDGAAANQLSYPFGVAIDGSGNLYVSDTANYRVQMFPPGSTSATAGTTVAGGNGYGDADNQLAFPFGVAIDGSGNLFVSETGNQRVQKWVPGATSGTTVAGGNGYGAAADQLSDPLGVAVDGAGNLYISDSPNDRVQRWVPGATSGTTIAGGNGQGDADNQLANPIGVAVDGAGNLYVGDTDNARVMAWSLVPSAPTGVVATRGNGSLSVAFAAPADDGGSEITSFGASCTSPNGGAAGAASGAGSPITVSGVTNGKSYTCTVRATNAVGTGVWSAASAPVVPATTPGVPTGVVTRSGYTTTGTGPLRVSFTAPDATGGSPITSYQASCTSSNGGVARTGTGTGSPLVVSGATTGKVYACKVRAFNAVGAGGWSAVSAAIVEGAPQAPSVTGVTRPAAGQLRVAYAVNGNNGSVFTGFTATCSSSNGGAARSKTVMVAAQRAITVTGLTVGKTYRCTVKAINARGTGPASTPSAEKTA